MKRILTVILLFLFCSQSFAFWWDTWSKKGTLYVVGGATKNVGIGTSEPLSLLHIAGTPSTLNQGLVFGDGDTGIAELLDDVLSFFIANSSKYYMGESEFRSSSASGFSLKTLSAISTIPNILPRLDDSNTGLGYITTDTFPMICGGVPVLTAKSVTGSAWVGIGNTNPAGALHVSTNYLFVSDAGNVGIGTTSPSLKLDVAGNIYVVDNGQVFAKGSGYLALGNNNLGICYIKGDGICTDVFAKENDLRLGWYRSDTATQEIMFGGENSSGVIEYARFNSSGNIGIGTTAPRTTLDLTGTFSSALVPTVNLVTGQIITPNSLVIYVSGDGAVATPTIGTLETNQILRIVGTDDTNTVVINAADSNLALSQGQSMTLGKYDFIELIGYPGGVAVESYRSDNTKL